MPLPSGWTLDRVNEVTQSTDAHLVEPVPFVLLEIRTPDSTEYQTVSAATVISVGGYFLVDEGANDDWLMGSGDGESIVCWAGYGSLERALLSL